MGKKAKDKSVNSDEKYGRLYKFLLRDNENLLSFLCGICSNIPITLLFAINTYGKNGCAHWYFFVWMCAFALSIGLTAFAFSATLKKIDIKKMIDKDVPESEKKAFLQNIVDNKIRGRFKLCKIMIIIFGVLLIAAVIALWVLANFAKY